MSIAHPRRTGAQILIDQLKIHGADTVFCVPGESYLAALDAVYDANSIRLVVCRQEGGAAMMADAYGKLTGRPGIVFATRGPGACNASSGVHVAMQDSTPLILFIGQVARGTRGREAFQEVDFRQMFGGMVKWADEIDDPRRLPELVSRAFHVATGGRPGPVVLALPEDMLTETAAVGDARPYERVEPHPGPAQMRALAAALAASARPVMLLGGSQWDEATVAAVEAFALANKLPVCCGFRRQDRFDNAHPCYAGDVGLGVNPRLAARLKDSDLLIVVGARLGEATSGGYTLLDIPVPQQRLVHIHPDPEELGRVYEPFLAINASPRSFAAALAALAPVAAPRWAAAAAEAHRDYLAWQEPVASPGALQMSELVRWLSDHLPDGAIICNGAGNFTTWVHRFYRYRRFGAQLAPTSGSMGYGFPAAVAAKLVHPERTVVCFAGDGDFLMTGQELATVMQHELALIVLVVNNGLYGTIRMHQERHYPGRVVGTTLTNPDFAALARAYGAYADTVTRTEDFAAAFARAVASGRPALIELKLDPEALTISQSTSQIRAAARAERG
ncbi:MAG TPA: thiamine pyrophosphate-binding protein [Stellaceae bacterium]|nr:thiamine pyrophosphate-binding protein [Stellaceae bacterium]